MSWPVCSVCDKAKDPDKFRKSSSQPNGRMPYCKSCRATNHIGAWTNLSKERKNASRRSREHQRRRLSVKIQKMYFAYCSSARRRGFSWELDQKLFAELVQDSCYYCGDPPSPLNGVDRINSKDGYYLGNVFTCCTMCNRMKLDYSLEEWLLKINKIAVRNLAKTMKIEEDLPSASESVA